MRLSRRADFGAEENPLTQALARRRAAGLPVLDLTGSDPVAAGLAPSEAELRRALTHVPLAAWAPEPQGLLSARAALSDRYAAAGLQVPPARLVLSASTSEAYGWLLALLSDAGGAWVVPAPSYPLLEWLAKLHDVRLVPYALGFDGAFFLDVPALAAVLEETPDAAAILHVHPGHPTAVTATREEAAALRALAGARELPLVIDEVFLGTAARPRPEAMGSFAGGADDGPLTFVLDGLSKRCALPQAKLGFSSVCGRGADDAVRRLADVADAFLSVSGPVQHALPALLALEPAVQARVRARLAANRAALAAVRAPHAAWDPVPGDGGFSSMIRVSRSRSDEAWALALLERGIAVQPGHLYDAPPGMIVVSLLPEEPVAAHAFRALATALDALA